MGYAFNGVCYQDTESALSAFVKSVPQVTSQGINSLTQQPTIDALGTVSWSISNRPFTGDVVVVRTGTTQLPQCQSESFDQWPVQSIVFYAALFFAAFVGFRTGFRP